MSYYNPGTYVCRVASTGFGEFGQNKTPALILIVKPVAQIVHAPEGEFEETCAQSYDRAVRLFVTDKTKDMVIKKLRHAGWEGENMVDIDELIGKDVRCRCEVTVSEGNGKSYDNFDLCLPPLEDREKPKPLDDSAKRRLNALFGKSLKTGVQRPAVGPKAAAIAQATADDDECPF